MHFRVLTSKQQPLAPTIINFIQVDVLAIDCPFSLTCFFYTLSPVLFFVLLHFVFPHVVSSAVLKKYFIMFLQFPILLPSVTNDVYIYIYIYICIYPWHLVQGLTSTLVV